MPFLWDELLREHGSIVGNADRGSVMQLSNRHRFSYPGYAELMLGVAHDDEIDSNDNRRYPHETILQFLRRSLDARREHVAWPSPTQPRAHVAWKIPSAREPRTLCTESRVRGDIWLVTGL